MGAARCTGHRNDGEPCKGWRVPGSDKCRRHLPNPKARANAAVRAEVISWGLGDVHVDPGEVLLRLVSQSARRAEDYAAELERHVAESPSLREALVAQAYGEFGPVGEYVRGLVALESQERDRCAAMAAKAIAAGLATRQVELAERMGQQMSEVLRAVLADPSLGLSAQQQSAVPGLVRRHLAIAA